MSGFFRTADKTANGIRRSIPVAIGTSPTAANAPVGVAHGITGTEQCVLTIALDNSFSAASTATITLQYWSVKAKQWFYAGTGAAGADQSVTLYPGGTCTFTLPEQTQYFISADSIIGANLLWTDCFDAPMGITGT